MKFAIDAFGGDNAPEAVIRGSIDAMQLNIPVDSITADSKLVDDLKADSLDIVELVTSLEEEYNIEISDEDIKNIRTVGDVVRFIESK